MSRLRATFQLTNPDTAEASMTITMPVGDWKALRQQLADTKNSMSFPACRLREMVADLIRGAEESFEASHESE